jgi:prolipoprotein diacylglyceryltransferase
LEYGSLTGLEKAAFTGSGGTSKNYPMMGQSFAWCDGLDQNEHTSCGVAMWGAFVGAKLAAIIWSNFLDKASTLVVISKGWLISKIVSLFWFLDVGVLMSTKYCIFGPLDLH